MNTDPKMFSAVLFKRLRDHQQGFSLLWKNRFQLEADIILRSALEAAICISALSRIQGEFVTLMRRDSIFTLLAQIKMYREADETKMVGDAEKMVRLLQKGLPEGVKGAKLDFKALAETGEAPVLYTWHRMLSGVSSHVTGLSILFDIGGDGMGERQEWLRKHNRKMHLMMMAGATIHGTIFHAINIEQHDIYDNAIGLANRLSELSREWPGVEKADGDPTVAGNDAVADMVRAAVHAAPGG